MQQNRLHFPMTRPNRCSMNDSLAFLNGRWVTHHDTHLSLDDWGVLQGVILVERLRTYGGKIFQLPRHIERLKDSVTAIGLNWDRWCNFNLVETCERVAASAIETLGQDEDIGLVILATPGAVHTNEPTRIVHASELPWKKLANWYESGQDLITASVRNVPSQCWPVHIKTRSRLHYFLADQQASQVGAYAGALMLDIDGNVTETSFANVMMINRDMELLAPVREKVLPGISLELALSLAQQLDISTRFTNISQDDLRDAKEILLTGTNGGIWHAKSIDGRALDVPGPDSVLSRLQNGWQQMVGLDFKKQAQRFINT